MTATRRSRPVPPDVRAAGGASRRWLVLIHQLPAHPSNLRVKTWRRLQQLGALPVKQAVYVLPDSEAAREDMEWLRTEIRDAGGDATLLAADSVDDWTDGELVEAFRRARAQDYASLGRDIAACARGARASAKPQEPEPAVRRQVAAFEARLRALVAIDFFGGAGRERVAARLDDLRRRSTQRLLPAGARRTDAGMTDLPSGRTWVTRPRPGIDRVGSAWLIKRFVDSAARFDFVDDPAAAPARAIPFDMFGVDFGHHGDACTFEVLMTRFGVADRAVQRLAEIVHDLDLKDRRFGSADAPTVGRLIDGLRAVTADDHLLLEQGALLFEALYRSFQDAQAPAAAPSRRGGGRRGPPRGSP
jgi:hypothetical protein